MASLAGYNVTIKVGNSSSPTDEATGINNVSLTDTRTMLDITSFEGNGGAMERLAGLRDVSITLSGFLNGDTEQVLLQDNHGTGTLTYVLVEFDGTGAPSLEVPCLVESIDYSAAVDGTVDVTYNLVSAGAPTLTN
ncbi:MAG TPA: phage tail tube protein [Acidimicrobiia bacterium]